MIGAWLKFLNQEPERLLPAQEADLASLARLVGRVTVADGDVIPDDVTFSWERYNVLENLGVRFIGAAVQE